MPAYRQLRETASPTGADRPGLREALLAGGPSPLGDGDLLAVFLGTGTAGRPVRALAADILAACGGLRGLLDRDAAELAALPGLGPARAARLVAALELGRRHLEARLDREGALAVARRMVCDFWTDGLRLLPLRRAFEAPRKPVWGVSPPLWACPLGRVRWVAKVLQPDGGSAYSGQDRRPALSIGCHPP